MNLNKQNNFSTSKKNIIARIFICIGILIAGILGMTQLASLKKPPAEAKIEERPLRVEAIIVEPKDFPVVITGYGEAKSLNTVTIAPEVSGKTVKVHPRLEKGEIIQKGDTLFMIDPTNYKAAFQEAEAGVRQWENTVVRLEKQFQIDQKRLKTIERNRKLALGEFERVKMLFEKDSVGTRSGVDRAEQTFNSVSDQADLMAQAVTLYPVRTNEAKSSLESVRARLILAKSNLDRCTIKAPFTSRIKSVLLEEGQFVSPGQNVVTLADDSLLEILVPLDSRDARTWLDFMNNDNKTPSAWFSKLNKVTCQIHWTEDKKGDGWTGFLDRVVKFDQKTRTLTVAVRVAAKSASSNRSGILPLVEGMFCEVKIPGKTLATAYKIPRKAVSFKNTVFIANSDRRLITTFVDVARTEGNYAYITGGLEPGDTVITTRLIDPLENSLLKIEIQNPSEDKS